jgi:hypothetical protein
MGIFIVSIPQTKAESNVLSFPKHGILKDGAF